MKANIDMTNKEEKAPPKIRPQKRQDVQVKVSEFRKVTFKGTAEEYFGIWIRNVMLTLATIGIYSAWAKVRRISYFHNKTEINNNAFLYHATGGQIFFGRFIAICIIAGVQLLSTVSSMVFKFDIQYTSYILYGCMIFAIPYAINRSLQFNARNTSWRNVRLDWHGTYGKTFFYTICGPLISAASLFTLAPLLTRHYYNYFASNHSFGTTAFKANPVVKSYYIAFLALVVVPVPFILLVGWIFAEVFAPDNYDGTYIPQSFFWGMYAAIFLLSVFLSAYLAQCRNLLLNTLKLGNDIRFKSTLLPFKFLWIVASNIILVVGTLGLMQPWAQVRKYKYLCENTHHNLEDGADEFVDSEIEYMEALGEEFADLYDLEMSI